LQRRSQWRQQARRKKRPNIVMLMTDDTGWNDFGAYSGGGANLGHPTPNVDKMAAEGAVFTCWYGQASCTAGRASFMTGRIPIRSALSVVVAPGDQNFLRKETPTIAEFFKKNGYSTYFSGKWHLSDVPDAYPTEHGFDEMKEFAAYYPGVYTYADTSQWFHPFFPSYNKAYLDEYNKIVNRFEWEGVAGQPAKQVAEITWDYLATFDVRQADSAIDYVQPRERRRAFLHGCELHEDAQPQQSSAEVRRQVSSRPVLGLHARARRQHRASHGRDPQGCAEHDRYRHRRQWRLAGRLAGRRDRTVPRREGSTTAPTSLVRRNILPASPGSTSTAKASARRAPTSAMIPRTQTSTSRGNTPSRRRTWLGPVLPSGGIGALYNLTMDPFEKYDMVFNGAVATRSTTTSPGRYAGMDNGCVLSLIRPVIMEFDQSIVDFPNIKRFPGGASNDQIPNLQNPDNPVPALDLRPGQPHPMGGMED
jgi:hypothetical protein